MVNSYLSMVVRKTARGKICALFTQSFYSNPHYKIKLDGILLRNWLSRLIQTIQKSTVAATYDIEAIISLPGWFQSSGLLAECLLVSLIQVAVCVSLTEGELHKTVTACTTLAAIRLTATLTTTQLRLCHHNNIHVIFVSSFIKYL